MAKTKPIVKDIGEVDFNLKYSTSQYVKFDYSVSDDIAVTVTLDPDEFDDVKNLQLFYKDVFAQNFTKQGDNPIIYYCNVQLTNLGFEKHTYSLTLILDDDQEEELATMEFELIPKNESTIVRLARPGIEETSDKKLWHAIKSNSLNFKEYEAFISKILNVEDKTLINRGDTFNKDKRDRVKHHSVFFGGQEYNLLKFGTEFYMLAKSALSNREVKNYLGTYKALPYYENISERLEDIRDEYDDALIDDKDNESLPIIEERLKTPFFIELIWSYWMEQGMLMQAMNLISLRFQNIDNGNMGQLARFDLSPLRRLNHILWGFIQDEQHRLSLPRRLREYDHEYGLTLTGRAVPAITPADSRLKFLEAFHNLLTTASIYFKEADDTTRIADAFPVLNSLKEVHLLLAEGNHNAYGNLTWTARHEMMMTQYIISREETRVFLGGRPMVPYPEQWMDRVDTIRNMLGWGSTSITYFYDLAIHGEKVLLAIRYGNWSDANTPVASAANWALAFRDSIQKYIHGYRTVTSVDLSAVSGSGVTRTIQPSILIQRRMGNERRQRRA